MEKQKNDEQQEQQQQHEDFDVLMEEMHYHNTINAFVELIVLYGWDKVMGDLRTSMGEKTW